MLLSTNWIREFVNLDGLDLDELIHRFTLSTAEVEDIYHMGEDTEKVVVAKILSVEKHPDSKKLHLLKVDNGTEVVDCVCGAPNVREGMLVAFACEGGKVSGHPINCAKVAGYESHGMCCSESELGMSDDHSGIIEIEEGTPLGTDIKELFGLDDVIFEVDNKSLTNRPDLWGHYGIAREFSALTGRELTPIEKLDLSKYNDLPQVSIDVQDDKLCYRYSAIKVENITKKVSPVKMRVRLYYCGLRAINLLADLTNYIMLELGQPMHAFDLTKVQNIQIKTFDKPLKFDTLDGVTRDIDESMLMICSNDTPVAVAGVMGGLDSEICDDTNSLLLESANFDGVSVRKTSTKLGLRTDASMRYEKVLDPEITTVAIERFLKLLTDIDPEIKVISALSDKYVKKYDIINLSFDKRYVDRYTGIEISNEQILKTLSSLGFDVKLENDTFFVTVPTWRATKDVTIKADLIEEITRIYGYDNFAIDTTLSGLRPAVMTRAKSDETMVKDLLVYKYNLHEVHSYIWCDTKKYKEIGIETRDNVKLLNAMTPEHTNLRYSMIPTLLSFVNENKGFAPEFGIFEIGKIIDGLTSDNLCNEKKHLGIALFSRISDEKSLFFKLRDIIAMLGYDIKHTNISFASTTSSNNWEHPINTASISLNGTQIGTMAVLHPSNKNKIDKKANIVFAEIDMDLFSSISSNDILYKEVSKFPGIDVDLSFIVNENIKYSDISKEWEENKYDYLTDVKLIDVYEGEQSSITLRFSFSSNEKTLSRNEIQPMLDKLIKNLEEKGIYMKK